MTGYAKEKSKAGEEVWSKRIDESYQGLGSHG